MWVWNVTIAHDHDALHRGEFDVRRVVTSGDNETDASLAALQIAGCFHYVAGLELVDWEDDYTHGECHWCGKLVSRDAPYCSQRCADADRG